MALDDVPLDLRGVAALKGRRNAQPALDRRQILEIIKREYPPLPVLMISGHGSTETTVEAMRLGAVDFIDKPFKSEHLLVRVGKYGMEAALAQPGATVMDMGGRTMGGFVVVGGDAIEPAIMAASILAKVSRDRLMVQLHATFPQYGFDVHKGYPTPAHLSALSRHGPCAHHRRSFAPVRDALAGR